MVNSGNRPLEDAASIELVTFESFEGKQVFWHSTAHMMGEAVERIYGGHLCYGPPRSPFILQQSNRSTIVIALSS